MPFQFSNTGGSATITEIEVDFGALPVADGYFNISDAAVTANSKIITTISRNAPTGKETDDVDMDNLKINALPGNGSFILYIKSSDGSYLADKFKINYLVG